MMMRMRMRTCDISVSQIDFKKWQKNSRSSFKAVSSKSKNHWFLPLLRRLAPQGIRNACFRFGTASFLSTRHQTTFFKSSARRKRRRKPSEGRRRRSYNLRLVCLKRKERPPKKNSNIPIEFGRKFSQFHWLLPDGISPCDHFLSRWDMWWCWLWPQVSNAQNPYNLWLNDHSSDWCIEILMINGLLESPYNWKVQSIYTANHQGFGHCSSGSSSPQNASPSFVIRLLCGHRNLAKEAHQMGETPWGETQTTRKEHNLKTLNSEVLEKQDVFVVLW